MAALACFHCGAMIAAENHGRQGVCEACGRDAHVCKNCRNFDLQAHNLCRESQAERVVDKEKANFCDWWKPSEGKGGTAAAKATLASAAEALFRKK